MSIQVPLLVIDRNLSWIKSTRDVTKLNVCRSRRCRAFGTWIGWIAKTFDYINRVTKRFRFRSTRCSEAISAYARLVKFNPSILACAKLGLHPLYRPLTRSHQFTTIGIGHQFNREEELTISLESHGFEPNFHYTDSDDSWMMLEKQVGVLFSLLIPQARLHLVRCDNSVIRNVSIYGDFNTPNNDGIDIEDSNNTIITDCHIDTGDDAICPKSSTGPVYNLTATNCWIRTKSCAIKFGSASFFNFEKLLFDNITIVDSHRGLGMQIRDGGNVSDVTFSNIKMRTRYYHPSWWGRAEPIYITTCPRHPDSKEGTISDVRFINISSVSENGVFLAGSKHGLLRNLKFQNVDLTYKRWTNYTGGLYDYRPGCQKMVKHRTGGMMLEHISGLEVDNVRMRWSRGSLEGWDVNPLLFRPSTIDGLSFHDWQSLDVQ
uniref:Polygalacturonase n=1 Tax=Aegilops tauschii TaxID=37682 RepID=M8CEJ5_AEGTA